MLFSFVFARRYEDTRSMISYTLVSASMCIKHMCSFIFRAADLRWGQAGRQRTSVRRTYLELQVCFQHVSITVQLTADPNAHNEDGHSARRHVPVSLYAQIHLQASAFEQSPTMLMKGSTGGKIGG